jgi:outer membrane protein assembly factor BamD (BamD/ComL family)
MEFENGEYQEAARDYEQYLKMPDSKNHAKALFHLGMSRALSGKPKDLRLAETAFRSLITGFPDSPYHDQAELIISLQSQIEHLKADVRGRDEKIRQLAEELQKLKAIDMQRRPSRPPPE